MIEDKEKELLAKIVLIDSSIESLTQALMKINNLLIKKEVDKPFYIHTFEIHESPGGDFIRILPYTRNYNYAIHRILILGYRKSKSGFVDSTKKTYYDINSAFCHLNLLHENATLQFYEVFESEKDADLGLYLHRINSKPSTFGNMIKVIYSKYKD